MNFFRKKSSPNYGKIIAISVACVAVASIIAVVLYVVGQNLGDASDPRTHM